MFLFISLEIEKLCLIGYAMGGGYLAVVGFETGDCNR